MLEILYHTPGLLLPVLHSGTLCWQLEIGRGQIIYMGEISKHYKSGLFSSEEPVVKHLLSNTRTRMLALLILCFCIWR